MCIRNIGAKEATDKVKKLSKVFPVWKDMCHANGMNYTEYDYEGKHPIKEGINKAGNYPCKRMDIPYTPGFHAFLRKKDAIRYNGYSSARIRKFWAKKEWITTCGIGIPHNFDNSVIVVLSHISTNEKSLT